MLGRASALAFCMLAFAIFWPVDSRSEETGRTLKFSAPLEDCAQGARLLIRYGVGLEGKVSFGISQVKLIIDTPAKISVSTLVSHPLECIPIVTGIRPNV